eukprot:s6017_g3.t1
MGGTPAPETSGVRLLGADSGDSNGQPVFMRMPPEYLPHFYAWLDAEDSETKALYISVDPLKDVVLELVGNLYGRRPAGSNYRKEFEKVVTNGLVSKEPLRGVLANRKGE